MLHQHLSNMSFRMAELLMLVRARTCEKSLDPLQAMNKPNARNSSQILQQPLKYELAPEASADGSFTRSDIHLHSPVKSQEPEHSIGHIESWFAAGAADATVEVKAKCALRVDRCCERGYFPNCGTQARQRRLRYGSRGAVKGDFRVLRLCRSHAFAAEVVRISTLTKRRLNVAGLHWKSVGTLSLPQSRWTVRFL